MPETSSANERVTRAQNRRRAQPREDGRVDAGDEECVDAAEASSPIPRGIRFNFEVDASTAPTNPASAIASPRVEIVTAPTAKPATEVSPRRRRLSRAFAIFESTAMAAAGLAALGLLALDYQEVQADTRVLPGIRLAGVDVGGLDEAALRAQATALAERGLSRPLELRAGDARTMTTAAELGALPSPEPAIARALAFGRSGDPIADLQARSAAAGGAVDLAIGYRFDARKALDQLLSLAPAVERPSLPTRFDFESRAVLPATPGSVLLAHDSLSAVAVGLAAGRSTIDLVVAPQPPVDDPLASWTGALDLHEVLGTFSTPYSSDPAYADRSHNLKLGAAALDGHVLAPGETMSFNAVVGERSDQAGFRYAPGITAGELVDVVGGGTCQISSTLYGAAFFAGLDLVEARPHSRPSAYVDMGLDSTVVDGMIDMKIRNPYDFPVVLHSAVHGGKVTIEVLGARRPYKVAFERELKEVLPYTTTLRSDAGLRAGATAVAQQGKRGFRVTRRRIFYTGEEVAKTEEWELFYPPTTEILRRGTSPNGPLPTTPPPAKLRDPAPSLRIVQ